LLIFLEENPKGFRFKKQLFGSGFSSKKIERLMKDLSVNFCQTQKIWGFLGCFVDEKKMIFYSNEK
jgi:hypothetical protein